MRRGIVVMGVLTGLCACKDGAADETGVAATEVMSGGPTAAPSTGGGEAGETSTGSPTSGPTSAGESGETAAGPTSGPTGDPTGDTTTADSETGDTGGVEPDPVPAEFTDCDAGPSGRDIAVDPGTYEGLVAGMQPGDRMLFAAGVYTGGLDIVGMNGAPGACFFFEGPGEGPRAVFVGSSSRNTVSIRDSSYVVVRGLELDGQGQLGDGVKAEGDAAYAHHVVLEDLHIHDHDGDLQIVGINTKCPTWRWVIRGCTIERVGTGIYLGNSNGDKPFVGGLVERNVVLDTLGYNMQIKHQDDRPALDGLPAQATTIIRHNVLSKQNGGLGGGDARPNLLLGHFPPAGPGADDQYLVYGNFFHDNPTEALFQGEGHVALYNNVFVAPSGPAIRIQPQNDVPKRIAIFFNSVHASGGGIRVAGGDPGYAQIVVGNAVVADPPLDGGTQADNAASLPGEADVFVDPAAPVGAGLDLHPLPGALAADVDTTMLAGYLRWDHDFDGRPRDGGFVGAYAGPADAGAWALARARKP